MATVLPLNKSFGNTIGNVAGKVAGDVIGKVDGKVDGEFMMLPIEVLEASHIAGPGILVIEYPVSAYLTILQKSQLFGWLFYASGLPCLFFARGLPCLFFARGLPCLFFARGLALVVAMQAGV